MTLEQVDSLPHGLVPVDEQIAKAAFSQFPTGVAAICAEVDGEPVGLVASTFTVGVSLAPPYASVAIQNASTTWPKLRRSARLGVSVLSSRQADACGQLAAKGRDRFAGLEISSTSGGSLFVTGASLWLDCEPVQELPAGDHVLVLLEVKGVRIDECEPLLYHNTQLRGMGLLVN